MTLDDMIGERTRHALAAAKARAVQLGNAEQAKANKRQADTYAKTLQLVLIVASPLACRENR